MISNTLVRKAVQVEYSLLRAPLAAVDRGLAARLGDGSKVRLTVHRGLGSLDALAGQLLAEPSASNPDTRTAPPSAAPPARTPAEQDVPADGDVTPTHDEIELSHDDQVERVVEELREEQEQKPVVGELANPDLQEVQAELRAKHLVETYEQEQRLKREHEERVRAAEAARTAPPRRTTATKAAAKEAAKAPAKKAAAKKSSPRSSAPSAS